MRSSMKRQPNSGAAVSRESPQAKGEQPAIEARLRWAFRTLITLHALEVFLQAVLAGAFLDGHSAMLGLHRENAITLVVLGYVQILVAFAYWRPGGGPIWPLWASVAMSVAETVQFFLGLGRLIGVHVPLGVAIVVCAVLLAQWAWRDTFGRRRDSGGGSG